jgi:hypothetical protein
VGGDAQVLHDRTVLRIEQQGRQKTVLGRRLLDHATQPVHRGHQTPGRRRRLLGGEHAGGALAALHAVEQRLR